MIYYMQEEIILEGLETHIRATLEEISWGSSIRKWGESNTQWGPGDTVGANERVFGYAWAETGESQVGV